MERSIKEKQHLLKEKYSGIENAAFLRDCKRLDAGEPLDYIIGWKEFMGCKIDLSKRPLIPREETEYWVAHLIDLLKTDTRESAVREMRVLDMFAGSGCAGIAILKLLPNSHIDFVDIKKECVEQCAINCRLNDIKSDRYKCIQSNLFCYAKPGSTNYDLIIANPPYISEKTAEVRVQKSVKEYEPSVALFAGADGLDVIKRFLEEAPEYLKPKGRIVMEFDDTQADKILQLCKLACIEANIYKDQFDRDRFIIGTKKG